MSPMPDHDHRDDDDPTNTHAVPSSSSPVPPPPPRSLIVPTTLDPATGQRVVPHFFEQCQVDDLIVLIASMLDRLIAHNDRIPLTPTSLTRFHSRAPPSINVKDYLLRIARYTNVEPVCLLILLHYVDKVCTRLPTFTISSLTVHRFVIAAVSVGSKALSDSFCTNGRYARVGGIGIAEMNLLEKEFCAAIDWRLTTSGTVLAHYYTSLVRSHPSYLLAPTPPPSPLPSPSSSSSRSDDIDMPDSSSLEAGPRGRSSPALVPARLRERRDGDKSNLPSPVRPPPPPPFPSPSPPSAPEQQQPPAGLPPPGKLKRGARRVGSPLRMGQVLGEGMVGLDELDGVGLDLAPRRPVTVGAGLFGTLATGGVPD